MCFINEVGLLYGLYYTETQSNILIIVILFQPELENDISTPAPAGQKPPELLQVSRLRCTALKLSVTLQCRSNMSAHARHSRKQDRGSNTKISDFRNPLVFSCNKLKIEKRMIILDIAAHCKYFCHESAECQTIQCPQLTLEICV